MMIVKTEETRKSFYPTPAKLAAKMLEGIDWKKVHSILEPSAGKGDLLLAIPEVIATEDVFGSCDSESDIYHYARRYDYFKGTVIHAIEIDPYLRGAIVPACQAAYKESEKDYDNSHKVYVELCKSLREKSKSELTDEDHATSLALLKTDSFLYERKSLFSEIHPIIVHDDFLTFDTFDKYDLILMNPPFHNGGQHLMKAISLAERYGGQIRCILNAETIQNAYTNDRKELIKTLEKYDADINYLPSEFVDAERPTDVTVALVKLDIPAPELHSDIWERMKKAADEGHKHRRTECEAISVTDVLEDAIAHYKVEVEAGVKLIHEYLGLRPMLMNSLNSEKYSSCMMGLSIGGHSVDGETDISRFLKEVRLKYWKALFENDKVMGKLTSNILNQYSSKIRDFEDYEFSMFNIQQLLAEMNASLKQNIEETIMELFEKMTAEHSWFNNSENIHYFNGWKTNKAHKINDKVIIPCYNMFSSYSNKLDTYTAEQTISDIEKVLDYFDGNMTATVDLRGVLQYAQDSGNTRNIPCKYFSVSIFKKGTMHIKFTNKELLERFNIYCCKGKAWLPPDYGSHTYEDMSDEAKAVVDGFHGDGSSGSGRKAYEDIMANTGYYLQSPVSENAVLMLGQ